MVARSLPPVSEQITTNLSAVHPTWRMQITRLGHHSDKIAGDPGPPTMEIHLEVVATVVDNQVDDQGHQRALAMRLRDLANDSKP